MQVVYSEVSKWLEMPSLSLSCEAGHLFLRGIQGWLSDGNIPVLLGSEVDRAKRPADLPGTPKPYMFRPSGADKVGQKQAHAEQAGRVVESIHVRDAYTDGSYAEEGPGGVAGYRVWFGARHPLNISSPLPTPVQKNNGAELTACLQALRAVPLSQPLCIITGSKYVYDGVTIYMHRWVPQARSAETLWQHVY